MGDVQPLSHYREQLHRPPDLRHDIYKQAAFPEVTVWHHLTPSDARLGEENNR